MREHAVIAVVAAVIEHEGLILACRRRPEKAAGGKWEFPGGKVERRESEEEALIREIREELDVEIVTCARLRTDDTSVGSQTIRLSCFLAKLLGELPTLSIDHDELRWLGAEDLAQLDWAAPDVPMVEQIVKRGLN
ncbi:(deoxy)nucleoside triphosphate pyrophosphohydrolase [Microbacterium sp. NPDC087868]|uniref:(deoxy)nucleoside triphosphate pyrophosphohydrolase n=1 Tax=Microbacterium sp. NPDC087868 TaxID=3364195 RepID=UPI00384A5469